MGSTPHNPGIILSITEGLRWGFLRSREVAHVTSVIGSRPPSGEPSITAGDGMRGYTTGAIVLASLGVLAACGSSGGSGAGCTLVGAATGVRLEIRPPFAARVAHASMTVCHDGSCRTSEVRLDPSTTTRPGGCAGGTCSASAVRTGGWYGFADVPGLATSPVKVTVELRGTSGDRVLRRTVTVTPKGVFPNGPRCGETGHQASVVVADGELRPGG